MSSLVTAVHILRVGVNIIWSLLKIRVGGKWQLSLFDWAWQSILTSLDVMRSTTLTTLVNLLSWPSHLLAWSVSARETEGGLLGSVPDLSTTILYRILYSCPCHCSFCLLPLEYNHSLFIITHNRLEEKALHFIFHLTCAYSIDIRWRQFIGDMKNMKFIIIFCLTPILKYKITAAYCLICTSSSQ